MSTLLPRLECLRPVDPLIVTPGQRGSGLAASEPGDAGRFLWAPEDARGRPSSVGLVGRAGGMALGVSVQEYREIEAGERWPDWDTFHRICELYGCPQAFVGSR
jgi:hypothetical protein